MSNESNGGFLNSKAFAQLANMDLDTVRRFISESREHLLVLNDVEETLRFNESSNEVKFESIDNDSKTVTTATLGLFKCDFTESSINIEGVTLSPLKSIYIAMNGKIVKSVNTETVVQKGLPSRKFSFTFRKSVLSKAPSKFFLTIGSSAGLFGGVLDEGDFVKGFPIVNVGGNGDLFQLLQTTHFITKYGDLSKRQSFNRPWQTKVLNAYSSFRAFFKEEFGLDLFVTYGTLLGFCRDGQFIDHDDDFDTCYISRSSTPQGVKDELLHILRTLRVKGRNFSIDTSGGFLRLEFEGVKMDLFPGWIEDGTFWMTNTTKFQADASLFFPAQEVVVQEISVLVPNKAEQFLELKYGSGWMKPDPAYKPVLKPGVSEHLARFKLSKVEQLEFLELSE